MSLVPGDPLAHRALESLIRAEANVRRRLSADLEREGLSATGFSVLVVLATAAGELELRALRARLRTSKANATEVVTTLEARGLVSRTRLLTDRRAATVTLTALGQELVDRLFPEHAHRVAAQLGGQRAGQRVERRLGHVVGGRPGAHVAQRARARGDVDDPRVRRAAQQRQEGERRAPRAEQVGLDRLADDAQIGVLG